MTLAYAFWHQPRPGVVAAEYETGLKEFHRQLTAEPIPGFLDSWTHRVPELPWLPGGGYEDWYLVEDFAALGTLAERAVDAVRRQTHDRAAGASAYGSGGVYALLTGDPLARAGWAGWFSKAAGISYPQLRASLDAAETQAVWQRQLVLGPAPEFRVLAAGPVDLSGAELTVGMPVAVSG